VRRTGKKDGGGKKRGDIQHKGGEEAIIPSGWERWKKEKRGRGITKLGGMRGKRKNQWGVRGGCTGVMTSRQTRTRIEREKELERK